ncbi:MAG: SiaB family protein kinase [Leptospirales bacterium]
MIDNLFQFKEQLNTDNIIFCINGPFTQELTSGIAESLKQKMDLEEVSVSTTMKLFSVLVEKAQNIIHYSVERAAKSIHEDEPTGTLAFGIIIVGYENDHYYILGGNKVKNIHVKALTEKLSLVQKMNKDELKKYYNEQRKKERKENHKGAGLGFIEISRKASSPIEFNFQKIDDTYSFFNITTII